MREIWLIPALANLVLNVGINRSFAQDPFWVKTGGPYEGYVNTVVVAHDGSLLAGTAESRLGSASTIFRSTDNATSWSNIFAMPNNENVLILATNSSIHFFAGATSGVYRSTDLGNSWTSSSFGLDGLTVQHLVVDENDYLFAATSNGVYRSTDNGGVWDRSSNGLNNVSVSWLTLAVGDLIYAATSSGIYLTMDKGDNWLFLGLPAENIYSLAINGQSHLFAGGTGELFRSTDNGISWTTVGDGLPSSVFHLNIDPDDRVFVGTHWGVYRSTDNGESWVEPDSGLLNTLVQAITSDEEGIVYVGTYGSGIYRSENAGDLWLQASFGLSDTYILSIVSPSPGVILTGTFSGYGGGASIFRSTSQGDLWLQVHSGVYDYEAVYDFAISGGNTFAGMSYGGIYRSTDLGNTWSEVAFYGVYSLTAAQDGVLFAGGGPFVYRSTNHGTSWTSHYIPCGECNTVEVVVASNGYVFAGISPLYHYSEPGIWRSTNDGETWTWLTPDLDLGYVWTLFCDSRNNLFASGSGGRLYVSMDLGETWFQVSSLVVKSIVEDSRGFLFAATSDALLQSVDSGLTWSEIAAGPMDAFMETLALDSLNFLYAGTGNGVFRSVEPIITAVSIAPEAPISFHLDQNYPNPFNSITTFSFSLHSSVFAHLSVYDILGRRVTTIVNEELGAGNYTHQWDARGMASGVYYFRLSVVPAARRDLVPHEGDGEAGEFLKTKKLILLR